MAGGKGSRMDVLTETRAKPALPYAGVYRLIDFPLSNCVHSAIGDVWVVEQFQPHALNDHLINGRPWDLDRTSGGLRIMPPFTGAEGAGFSEGNADAIYQNRRFIRDFDPDVLLVLSADHVYTLDYRDVVDAHLDASAAVTMVTTRAPEDPSRFGVVQVGDGGRVTGFEYKPKRPEGDLVTTEVFAYDARVLLDLVESLAADAQRAQEGDGDDDEKDGAQLKDFGDSIIPRLVEDGRAVAFPLDGYWRDVGVIESYWASHMELLAGRDAGSPSLQLDRPEWPILTYATMRRPALVAASARLENSFVAPGCTVRGRVVNSVLSPGVVIEEGAEVRDSVLFHDAVVRRGASVGAAILDVRVEVGAGAVVGTRDSDGPLVVQRPPPPIAVVGRGRVLGPRSTTEAGARVAPEPPNDGAGEPHTARGATGNG